MRTSLHFVFGSYNELSIKTSERLRRNVKSTGIDITNITNSDKVPNQMEKCWNSPSHKRLLWGRDIADTFITDMDVYLSGCMVNEDVVSAKHLAKQADTSLKRMASCLQHLSQKVQEADDGLILHCAHEVKNG